jgi:hypothetical protein
MAYRVLKPISADDGSIIPTGTLVDAGGWRNVRALVNGRYLAEVMDAPAPAPAPVREEEIVEEKPKAKAKKTVVTE